jgi:hypothetical protein
LIEEGAEGQRANGLLLNNATTVDKNWVYVLPEEIL